MRDIFALFSSCNRHRNPTRETWWAPFRRCRIRAGSPAIADSESRPETGSEPARLQSSPPGTHPAVRHRPTAVDSAAFPSILVPQTTD